MVTGSKVLRSTGGVKTLPWHTCALVNLPLIEIDVGNGQYLARLINANVVTIEKHEDFEQALDVVALIEVERHLERPFPTSLIGEPLRRDLAHATIASRPNL